MTYELSDRKLCRQLLVQRGRFRANFKYVRPSFLLPVSALTLLVGRREGHPACKSVGCWFVGGDWSFACTSYNSSCHHSPPPSSLAPRKSRMETFWCPLTKVVTVTTAERRRRRRKTFLLDLCIWTEQTDRRTDGRQRCIIWHSTEGRSRSETQSP